MRFLQVGFNKCGTTSIARFFARCGLKCVDWDNGNLARRIKLNLESGQPPLRGYEEFEVFTDMNYASHTEIIEAGKLVDQLVDHLPDARFILNVRDKDDWLQSRHRHKGGSLVERYMSAYGLPSEQAVLDFWSHDWDEHHTRVIDAVPDDRLLVFDIAEDPPEMLCEFAGIDPSKARLYRAENVRA